MRDGGKGDTPRPLGVSMEQFDSSWDRIFNRAKVAEAIQQTIDEYGVLLKDLSDHEKECGK